VISPGPAQATFVEADLGPAVGAGPVLSAPGPGANARRQAPGHCEATAYYPGRQTFHQRETPGCVLAPGLRRPPAGTVSVCRSARASLPAPRFAAFSSLLPAGLDAFVPAGMEAIVSSQR
jgi:hypothetical protein